MSSHKFKLSIAPNGDMLAVYDDRLAEFFDEAGTAKPKRASHVEPDPDGGWLADMSPVNGPVFKGFKLRSEALAAELAYLDEQLF